jgi:arylsulfatase A-like enzyme
MDLFPTFCQLAGASLPAGREYDGVDISDVLFRNGSGREPLLFYYWGSGLHAVRRGDWKLRIAPEEYPELYHLGRDPAEKYNVAQQNPAIVAELSALMRKQRETVKPGKLDRVTPPSA